MSSKKNTLEYIAESEEIHGKGTFIYVKTKYINRYSSIIITCPMHGDFIISEAKNHLYKKQGCPSLLKFNKWLGKGTERFKDKLYTFSSELYSNTEKAIYDRVIVTCERHQVCFTVDPRRVLLKGETTCLCILCREEKLQEEKRRKEENKIKERERKVLERKLNSVKRHNAPSPFKLSTEEVIRRVHSTYGEDNDCSKLEYVDSRTYFHFTCIKHNYICRSSVERMRKEPNIIKCPHCRKEFYEAKRVIEREEEKKEYIRLSNIKYNNKFDYSKIEYVSYSSKACIICPIHGEFYQSFRTHLLETTTWGCPKCGAENSCGYRRSDYINKCNGREAMLYLVEMRLGDEVLYKVGITVNSISRRFRGSRTPYKVKLISQYKGEAGLIYDME